MSLNIYEFNELTCLLFLIYIFLETKIYLALWAGFFYASKLIMYVGHVNRSTYKTIIACYVLILLVGYSYKFKGVLFGKEIVENVKFKKISADKKKISRIGLASLLLIIVNIVAIIVIH